MIYLIGGTPRVGKSIIAERLMREIAVPWLSTDVLRTLVRDLTLKQQQQKKFPFKGFESSNELSALQISEMVEFQLTETKSLQPCLDSFISHQIGVRDDQIIEGVHLLPKQVKKLIDFEKYQGQIKAVFIVCLDADIQLQAMKKNMGRFDWLADATDKTLESVAAFVVEYSQLIQKDCERYDLPCIRRKGDFERENQKILRLLRK